MKNKFWCTLHGKTLSTQKAMSCMKAKCESAPKGKTCSHLTRTRSQQNANGSHSRRSGRRRSLLKQARSLDPSDPEADPAIRTPSSRTSRLLRYRIWMARTSHLRSRRRTNHHDSCNHLRLLLHGLHLYHYPHSQSQERHPIHVC